MPLRRVWTYLPKMPFRRVHKSRLGVVGVMGGAAVLALIPASQPASYAAAASRVHPPATTTAVGRAAAEVTNAVPGISARPLAGLIIALDPGHNLGNASHPKQINRKVWVGLWKICNTTGTATNSGFPEASFNFSVATRLRRALQSLGATVVMTRYVNSNGTWGPCIDYRGKFGKAQHAVLKVSIHADGAPAHGRGFHIITPGFRRGYTDDIFRSSRRLGLAMRAGMLAGGIRLSNYIAHGWSVRRDQGTLNMSDIPTIIVETGNMRNASDAALETSRRGRQRYALALLRGIRLYLRR